MFYSECLEKKKKNPLYIECPSLLSASPGSTEIFGRRLAGHLLGLDFRCTPTLPTCLQAVKGQFSQLERLNYPKKGIKTIKDALHMRLLTSIMEEGQNYDISSLSQKEGNFMRHDMDDLSHALTGNTLYQRDRESMLASRYQRLVACILGYFLLPLNLLYSNSVFSANTLLLYITLRHTLATE